MAEFEIESGRISGYAGQMEGYSGQLKAQKGRVTDVAWKLALQGGTQNVKKALAKIASDLEKQQVQVKQYGQILENIRKEYQNTEAAIVTAASPQKKVEEEKNEVLGTETNFLFQHEDIARVEFYGYDAEARKVFIRKLAEVYQEELREKR